MTWNALRLTALLALDTFLSFTDTPRVQDLRESIITNVVARDTLEGTYTR